MRGIVKKSTGSWYKVFSEDGRNFDARIRGKFRLAGYDFTNPIAVGDRVVLEIDPKDPGIAMIIELEERRNYIVRKSNKLSKRRQIIASNIDRALLMVSLVSPRTSTGFIDRFLVACEAFHIPALLYFNKLDLINPEDRGLVDSLVSMYASLGYGTLAGSATNPEDTKELRKIVEGQSSLFAGHSGAGKSTLLNNLFPDANARVGAISNYHEKGKHTTTFAEMFVLPGNTYIIDTPGIRDFGIMDIPDVEIAHFFPEMRDAMKDCRYHNCMHISEPGCRIKDLVESGDIHFERYLNYLSIIRNEDIFE